MGALLNYFAAEGVTIEAAGDGKVRAHGPLTDALRTAIRANKAALLAELAANDAAVDPDADRRRGRALAILASEPTRDIAVVAEAGDPAHVTVAIRGVAVGDLEIPAESYALRWANPDPNYVPSRDDFWRSQTHQIPLLLGGMIARAMSLPEMGVSAMATQNTYDALNALRRRLGIGE
ncbi:MAG: hypothetical protein ACM3SX_17300 [Deltaproteobacteria bacterium]